MVRSGRKLGAAPSVRVMLTYSLYSFCGTMSLTGWPRMHEVSYAQQRATLRIV